MSGGQVKNSVQVYWQYISDKLIDYRTSRNLTYLARGTSENFKIFLPLCMHGSLKHVDYGNTIKISFTFHFDIIQTSVILPINVIYL